MSGASRSFFLHDCIFLVISQGRDRDRGQISRDFDEGINIDMVNNVNFLINTKTYTESRTYIPIGKTGIKEKTVLALETFRLSADTKEQAFHVALKAVWALVLVSQWGGAF